MADKLVNVSQAAEMLGVSTKIMRMWDNDGKVEAVRTAGGHRRYRVSEIEKLQGIEKPPEEVKKEAIVHFSSQIKKNKSNHIFFADNDTILVCLSVDICCVLQEK